MIAHAAPSYGEWNSTGRCPGMGALERADHRVTLADAPELLAVVVERDDPRHLRERAALVRATGSFELHEYWTV